MNTDQKTEKTGLENRLYQRAANRLHKVLNEPLNKHLAALSCAEVMKLIGEDNSRTTLRGLYQLTPIRNHLYHKHIDEYVAEETDQFLREIDHLKSQVGDLSDRLNEVIV